MGPILSEKLILEGHIAVKHFHLPGNYEKLGPAFIAKHNKDKETLDRLESKLEELENRASFNFDGIDETVSLRREIKLLSDKMSIELE